MAPWRARDFHFDDLDAAVRLWDTPAASSEAPAFGLSDLIAAVRSHEPAVVAAVGDELVGVAVATVTGDRAWVRRLHVPAAQVHAAEEAGLQHPGEVPPHQHRRAADQRRPPKPPDSMAGSPGLGCSVCWCGHPHGMGTGRRPVHGVCVAVDVHYLGPGGARAAAVAAADATFARVLGERTMVVAEVAGYRPGEFYRRELPPLRAVLHDVAGLGLLVVDGYADLDLGGRPGLGAHAYREFAVPVIGVAKSAFRTATHAIPVLRGTSARPVFVTAAGMPRAEAAALVRRMAGRFRIPDALRRADQLARTGVSAAI